MLKLRLYGTLLSLPYFLYRLNDNIYAITEQYDGQRRNYTLIVPKQDSAKVPLIRKLCYPRELYDGYRWKSVSHDRSAEYKVGNR